MKQGIQVVLMGERIKWVLQPSNCHIIKDEIQMKNNLYLIFINMATTNKDNSPVVAKKVSIVFSVLLAVFMITMIIIYGFLTVYYQQTRTDESGNTVPNYTKGVAGTITLIMDTVFTLLGFGLILSPYKNAKWTGMAVALFVVSFNIILGLLFQDMWFEIFFGFRKDSVGGVGLTAAPNAFQFWNRHERVGKATASYMSFRLSNLCSTSYLVGMTAYSGRASIQKLALSLPIFCFLFYLNLYVNSLACFSTKNKDGSFVYFDAYGTILVYLFGGVYGLLVGVFTKTPRETQQQEERARKSRVSLQLSMLGAFFLFATFCLSYTSILTGLPGSPYYFRYNSQAILVMFGLSSGILGNYTISLLLGKGKMNLQSVIMGTISGGIMVGGLADVIQNIGACLFIGWIAGIIGGLFMHLVTPKMNAKAVIDSQGMLGPILVVAFIACFVIHPSVLSQFYVRNYFFTPRGVGYAEPDYRPARYHLVYFAITLGIAAITGAIVGLIYKIKRKRQTDYEDTKFFAADYGLYIYDYENARYEDARNNYAGGQSSNQLNPQLQRVGSAENIGPGIM